MILSTRLYVGVFIAIVLTGALGYGVIYPVLTTNVLSTCDPEGLNDSNFLAGCTAPLFDDYEHGAYYFGLEQTAIAHLQRAEVLVLGDSKAMFAFSTQATAESFRNLGARYHLMGFGAETSRFALAVMQKYKLRPKAVIINADPFFYDFTQYENIIGNKPGTYLYYVLEKYFLQAQRHFCSRPSTGSVLCGKNKTIYRAKIDGSWQLDRYVINPQSIPVPPHKPYLNWSGVDLVTMARKARPLLPVPDRCIILTLTPSERATWPETQSIAKALNATLLVLPFDGYHTIDTVHLARDDAERWSGEFLKRATGILRECLAD